MSAMRSGSSLKISPVLRLRPCFDREHAVEQVAQQPQLDARRRREHRRDAAAARQARRHRERRRRRERKDHARDRDRVRAHAGRRQAPGQRPRPPRVARCQHSPRRRRLSRHRHRFYLFRSLPVVRLCGSPVAAAGPSAGRGAEAPRYERVENAQPDYRTTGLPDRTTAWEKRPVRMNARTSGHTSAKRA